MVHGMIPKFEASDSAPGAGVFTRGKANLTAAVKQIYLRVMCEWIK